MSLYWDVYCKDCKVKCGIDNANHEIDLMRELVKHRHAVAAIAPLVNDTCLQLSPFNSQSIGMLVHVDWFAQHHEHNLVPMSEYGDVPDDACENQNCRARGELRELIVDQSRWLLCGPCRSAAIELVTGSLKEPEPY